jgi:hypothetical protein
MQAMANSAAFWLVLILALFAGYFLPTWIALGRRVDGVPLVIIVNLIGLIAWPAALILACGLPRREGPAPQPQWLAPPPWSAPPPSASPRNVLVMRADQRDPDSFSAVRQHRRPGA